MNLYKIQYLSPYTSEDIGTCPYDQFLGCEEEEMFAIVDLLEESTGVRILLTENEGRRMIIPEAKFRVDALNRYVVIYKEADA